MGDIFAVDEGCWARAGRQQPQPGLTVPYDVLDAMDEAAEEQDPSPCIHPGRRGVRWLIHDKKEKLEAERRGEGRPGRAIYVWWVVVAQRRGERRGGEGRGKANGTGRRGDESEYRHTHTHTHTHTNRGNSQRPSPHLSGFR